MKLLWIERKAKSNYVQAVWMLWITVIFLGVLFAGGGDYVASRIVEGVNDSLFSDEGSTVPEVVTSVAPVEVSSVLHEKESSQTRYVLENRPVQYGNRNSF